MIRMSALVSGQVQGVGYRRFVQRRALDMGVVGYAENHSDGKVEIVAEGLREDLERLLHWIRQGPPHAEVSEVALEWNESTGLKGFYTY